MTCQRLHTLSIRDPKFKPKQSDMESCFYLSVITNRKSDAGKAADRFIQKHFHNIDKGPQTVLDMPTKQK